MRIAVVVVLVVAPVVSVIIQYNMLYRITYVYQGSGHIILGKSCKIIKSNKKHQKDIKNKKVYPPPPLYLQ